MADNIVGWKRDKKKKWDFNVFLKLKIKYNDCEYIMYNNWWKSCWKRNKKRTLFKVKNKIQFDLFNC